MSIQLNDAQDQAVAMAGFASQNKGKVVILSGPAGTGKTTTLKEICSRLPGSIILAPTGRAALRATEITGQSAMTIHRWMYNPRINPVTGEIICFDRRGFGEIILPESNLLIIDEASMVHQTIWEDIHRLAVVSGLSILLVGDNFQLPPVTKEGEPEFSVFNKDFPCDRRVDLTEVFRQALQSPILRMATNIRQCMNWKLAKDFLSEFVVDSSGGVKEAARQLISLANAGEDASVISYTNAVRHDVNRKSRMESQIDPDSDPLSGEPLLIMKNSYNAGVFNGQLVDFSGFDETYDVNRHRFGTTSINGFTCTLSLSELLGGTPPDFSTTRGLKKPYISANLGYCLTCHKAQGDEWDNVIMIFEKKLMAMDPIMRIRWAYTCSTRARKNLYIYTINN